MQDTVKTLKGQGAILKNLETQMGEISKHLSERP